MGPSVLSPELTHRGLGEHENRGCPPEQPVKKVFHQMKSLLSRIRINIKWETGIHCRVSTNFCSQRAPYLREAGLDSLRRGTFGSSPPQGGSEKLWRKGRGGWEEGRGQWREDSPGESNHIVLMAYFAFLTNFPLKLIFTYICVSSAHLKACREAKKLVVMRWHLVVG